MPDVVKVTAHEASYGDTNIPDARAFTIHLHRDKPFTHEAATDPDSQAVEGWHITSVELR
jgi:hypothetical protein